MARCCCRCWVPSPSSNERSSRNANAKGSRWPRTAASTEAARNPLPAARFSICGTALRPVRRRREWRASSGSAGRRCTSTYASKSGAIGQRPPRPEQQPQRYFSWTVDHWSPPHGPMPPAARSAKRVDSPYLLIHEKTTAIFSCAGSRATFFGVSITNVFLSDRTVNRRVVTSAGSKARASAESPPPRRSPEIPVPQADRLPNMDGR